MKKLTLAACLAAAAFVVGCELNPEELTAVQSAKEQVLPFCGQMLEHGYRRCLVFVETRQRGLTIVTGMRPDGILHRSDDTLLIPWEEDIVAVEGIVPHGPLARAYFTPEP